MKQDEHQECTVKEVGKKNSDSADIGSNTPTDNIAAINYDEANKQTTNQPTSRPIDRPNKETDEQTNRQTNKQTDKQGGEARGLED